MLTYGLTRHRPLLLVAGFAALATTIARLCIYRGWRNETFGFFDDRPTTVFRIGFGTNILACVLLLSGLILLLSRIAAARVLLIISAFVSIASQVVMQSTQNWTSEERWAFVVQFTLSTSQFSILTITLLLLAGVGSSRRAKAEPFDEHLLRERAVGGYSGYVFTMALGTIALWVVFYFKDPQQMRGLLKPSGTEDWVILANIAFMLAAAGLGIAAWVMIMARRRLAGIAIVGFAAIHFMGNIVDCVQMHLTEERNRRAWSNSDATTMLWGIWPPLGSIPSAIELIELAGLALFGIVWGLRYFRAPPRLDVASAFELMIRPPPLPPPPHEPVLK